jgi:hypothetical protein
MIEIEIEIEIEKGVGRSMTDPTNVSADFLKSF